MEITSTATYFNHLGHDYVREVSNILVAIDSVKWFKVFDDSAEYTLFEIYDNELALLLEAEYEQSTLNYLVPKLII